MIPSDPEQIKKLKELADRNIANGDWGDEITFPGEDVAITPKEREVKDTVSHIVSETGDEPLPEHE